MELSLQGLNQYVSLVIIGLYVLYQEYKRRHDPDCSRALHQETRRELREAVAAARSELMFAPRPVIKANRPTTTTTLTDPHFDGVAGDMCSGTTSAGIRWTEQQFLFPWDADVGPDTPRSSTLSELWVAHDEWKDVAGELLGEVAEEKERAAGWKSRVEAVEAENEALAAEVESVLRMLDDTNSKFTLELVRHVEQQFAQGRLRLQATTAVQHCDQCDTHAPECQRLAREIERRSVAFQELKREHEETWAAIDKHAIRITHRPGPEGKVVEARVTLGDCSHAIVKSGDKSALAAVRSLMSRINAGTGDVTLTE